MTAYAQAHALLARLLRPHWPTLDQGVANALDGALAHLEHRALGARPPAQWLISPEGITRAADPGEMRTRIHCPPALAHGLLRALTAPESVVEVDAPHAWVTRQKSRVADRLKWARMPLLEAAVRDCAARPAGPDRSTLVYAPRSLPIELAANSGEVARKPLGGFVGFPAPIHPPE